MRWASRVRNEPESHGGWGHERAKSSTEGKDSRASGCRSLRRSLSVRHSSKGLSRLDARISPSRQSCLYGVRSSWRSRERLSDGSCSSSNEKHQL